MKLSKSSVLIALGASLLGAGLIVACGGDDDGGTAPTSDAGAKADTGSTVADTGTGTDSGGIDAGSDAATDAGDGGLKALGEGCATGAECASNVCFVGGSGGGGGGGGGATAGYCSLACTMAGAEMDPICTAHAPPFSGKCNMKLFCQKM